MQTLIIAGGSGYLGKILINYFKTEYKIIIITRAKSTVSNKIQYINWNDNWQKHLNTESILINFSGKAINCLFTKKNKKLLINSRVNTTIKLNKAITENENPPKLFINASGISIYKETYKTNYDEYNFEYQNDFLGNLSQKWEQAFYQTKTPKTRKVAIRISPVLGKESNAIKSLLPIVKLGLGGKQGNGKQLFPFIHQTDFVRAIKHIIETESLTDSINLIAPISTTNQNFMHIFRKQLGVKIGIPTPAFLLYISKYITKVEPELILTSSFANPKKLIDSNFTFEYPDIASALSEIIN